MSPRIDRAAIVRVLRGPAGLFLISIVLLAGGIVTAIVVGPPPREITRSEEVPPPPPAQTETPTPDPNIWRFEGRVVDQQGSSLTGVCVVIGPTGCRPGSPRTDDRGLYYIEIPKRTTIVYDLTFEKDGYVTVTHRARPTGPTTFNVVMSKRD